MDHISSTIVQLFLTVVLTATFAVAQESKREPKLLLLCSLHSAVD